METIKWTSNQDDISFIIQHCACFDAGGHKGYSERLNSGNYTTDEGYENATRVLFFGCEIPYIPVKFLDKFRVVQHIRFSYGRLKSIHPEDFQNNTQLKSLAASHSDLTELPAFNLNTQQKSKR